MVEKVLRRELLKHPHPGLQIPCVPVRYPLTEEVEDAIDDVIDGVVGI